ncbi:MAG: DpnI domain-containing protein [Terriglobia bacterium]
MQIRLPRQLVGGYKSLSQQARVVTEAWGERNFYCLNCSSPRLERTRHGTEAIDYTCPRCEAPYQLKGQSRALGGRIMDAAYEAMLRAIRGGRTPNLFALHYDRTDWRVRNLILVPRFVFTESAIEKRRPLSRFARRRGWVGCNIVLENLPGDARIPLVVDGRVQEPRAARKQYEAMRPLEKIGMEARGWTLDVLKVVRGLRRREFTLADAYACTGELARLHPRNRHVEPKIRQQLQRLRDLGFVEFLGRGCYRLKH